MYIYVCVYLINSTAGMNLLKIVTYINISGRSLYKLQTRYEIN